jgi:hypothetical protein
MVFAGTTQLVITFIHCVALSVMKSAYNCSRLWTSAFIYSGARPMACMISSFAWVQTLLH